MASGTDTSAHVDGAPVIGESTPIDAALFLAGVVASLVPIVGGPAATVAAEARRVMDRRQAERLSATIDGLRDALERLGEEVHRDLSTDSSFAAFVESALESASQARHAEMRDYYVALMARAATVAGPEEIRRGMLLSTLDRVEVAHLRLLQAVASCPAPERMSDFGRAGTGSFAALDEALPGVGIVFIHRVWEDLVALGLLASWTDVLVTEDAPVDLTAGPVTPFGRAFIESVTPLGGGAAPSP